MVDLENTWHQHLISDRAPFLESFQAYKISNKNAAEMCPCGAKVILAEIFSDRNRYLASRFCVDCEMPTFEELKQTLRVNSPFRTVPQSKDHEMEMSELSSIPFLSDNSSDETKSSPSSDLAMKKSKAFAYLLTIGTNAMIQYKEKKEKTSQFDLEKAKHAVFAAEQKVVETAMLMAGLQQTNDFMKTLEEDTQELTAARLRLKRATELAEAAKNDNLALSNPEDEEAVRRASVLMQASSYKDLSVSMRLTSNPMMPIDSSFYIRTGTLLSTKSSLNPKQQESLWMSLGESDEDVESFYDDCESSSSIGNILTSTVDAPTMLESIPVSSSSNSPLGNATLDETSSGNGSQGLAEELFGRGFEVWKHARKKSSRHSLRKVLIRILADPPPSNGADPKDGDWREYTLQWGEHKMNGESRSIYLKSVTSIDLISSEFEDAEMRILTIVSSERTLSIEFSSNVQRDEFAELLSTHLGL
eukprot:CAMPEP_0171456148 /NCGR_PEP_ID=MMETSP0945-20130129/2754_1 /TAXON_ID=109269 /ORGANISM="Vaucheria litorea, Strain CCMP2940" /LENGTH=473 /DNA_ID=CAMNT_0011981521 /DNA_START=442 /DNA_END=1863 /DNA_ORIENTATION=+